jgi:uncharacterized protein (TIGR02271 family)
MID